VAAIAAANYVDSEDLSMTSKGAGLFQSLWKAGGRPAAGSNPGSTSGVVCTSSTAGALPYPNPGGSNTGYLARMEVSASVAGSFILYDRLVASDGLSGTSTSSQTVGTPSLTRWTSGVGVSAWIEIYTATGATQVTATVSYTNQAGTAGQSGTCVIPASPVAGEMFPIALASGDTGVQAVASVTLSASTGTAGSFGVTLAYRCVTVPIVLANVGVLLDYAQLGLPVIANSACLAWKVLCTTTTTGVVIAGFMFAQG
jgi:hypothetical protein